ncbi:unnamed protein product, partial [Nesidiocoris tenuis]
MGHGRRTWKIHGAPPPGRGRPPPPRTPTHITGTVPRHGTSTTTSIENRTKKIYNGVPALLASKTPILARKNS